MRNYAVFIFLTLILVPFVGIGQTNVSGGNVQGTWTRANAPYIVESGVVVQDNSELNIEAGVQVLFMDSAYMEVKGSINAIGTNMSNIVLTAHDTSKGWLGIRILQHSKSMDSSEFTYCKISFAKQLERDVWKNFGAVLIDSVPYVSFSNCSFISNQSFVYGCIKMQYSTVRINRCIFQNNKAIDLNTVNPSNTDGPFASCIGSRYSRVEIIDSEFRGNSSIAPNYNDRGVRPRAGGMISFLGNKVQIRGSAFEGNLAENGYLIQYKSFDLDHLRKDSFEFIDNTVKGNRIEDNDIIRIDGSTHQNLRALLEGCIFSENVCTNLARGSVVNCYNNNGSSNDVKVSGCKWLNNRMRRGLFIFSDAKVSLLNSFIHGQEGTGIEVRQTSLSNMVNCVISNNWMGIESAFNADFDVVNSVIAYNSRINATNPYPIDTSFKSYHVSGGLYISDRGKFNVYNSIVSHNRGHLGQMSNLFAIDRAIFAGKVHNTILEGGLDSTYRQPIDHPWVKSGKVPVSSLVDMSVLSPTYLKPPQTTGRNGYLTDVNFRIKEICQVSDVIDKGSNFILGLPINIWPEGKDLSGNPRVLCKTMDIGPYEVPGQKYETILAQPWLDTVVCDNDIQSFNPQVCGFEVNYSWQYSTNKSNWVNLSSSDFKENQVLDPNQGYYRVITNQKECAVTDTFGPTQLSLREAPEPYLGKDTSLKTTDTLWLTPGNFEAYQWNIAGGDTSFAAVIGQRYQNVKQKIVWVEVTAINGCTERDSITIKFTSSNGNVSNYARLNGIVFPNPCQKYIHVVLNTNDKAQVRISDLLGNQILKQEYLSGEPIDLDALPLGVYVLRVTSETQYYQTQIIKSANH